jgi:hypothetical protein
LWSMNLSLNEARRIAVRAQSLDDSAKPQLSSSRRPDPAGLLRSLMLRPADTRFEAPEAGPLRAQSRSQSEADARTRTGDPFITSEVLYQLSYVGRGT